MHHRLSHRGFSLVGIIVSIGVFVLFAFGIYNGILLIYHVISQSRIHMLESNIANREIEFIRQLPYEEVGIENGIPDGVLAQTSTTTQSGIEFTVTRSVLYKDDPLDGTLGGTPDDEEPADYKMVEVSISWCVQTTGSGCHKHDCGTRRCDRRSNTRRTIY